MNQGQSDASLNENAPVFVPGGGLLPVHAQAPERTTKRLKFFKSCVWSSHFLLVAHTSMAYLGTAPNAQGTEGVVKILKLNILPLEVIPSWLVEDRQCNVNR